MAESSSAWSCRRFEVLYRDVVLPLLRRSEFQRQRLKEPVPTISSRPVGLPYASVSDVRGIAECHPEAIVSVTPRSSRRVSLKGDTFGGRVANGRRREHGSDTRSTSSGSEADFGEEYAVGKDQQIQRLWRTLEEQLEYFVRVLGHHGSSTASYRSRGSASTSLEKPDRDIWKQSGCRDFEFDLSQLKNAIETCSPELIHVSSSHTPFGENSVADKSSTVQGPAEPQAAAGSAPAAATALDGPEMVNLRQSVVIFLVDLLSSRLNLHQIECLYLLTATIQSLNNDTPVALSVQGCCLPVCSLASRPSSADLSSSLALSPFGQFIVDMACARFRREQLYHLWCLHELALDIYPLDQPGVGDSKSVGLIPLCFFKKLIAGGFLENAIAALKFLMFESTRQRAQLPSLSGEACRDPLEVTEWVDRAWSRRLAQIVVRLLMILVARFHASPHVLLGITEFLEGAAFEEHAIRKIRETVFSNEQERRSTSLTARDFDFASSQDLCAKENRLDTHDPWSAILEPSNDILDMTSVLVLLFLEIVDPSIAKWDVAVTNELQAACSLEEVELPTASLAAWLSSSGAPPSSALAPTYAWLVKRSADHDIEPFWIESTMYGRLLSFAVSVGYMKPSDTRRLQLALSPAWNLFGVLKSEFLDRLGGSSPLAKIAVQTVDSLLQQTVLPLNTQWSGHIIRMEKLTRLASQKSKQLAGHLAASVTSTEASVALSTAQPSFLEPVVGLINRVASMLPTSIPAYAPIFFALVDSFPWLELTSRASGLPEQLLPGLALPELRRKPGGVLDSVTFNADAELCEVGVNQSAIDDEDIPSQSGVGFPVKNQWRTTTRTAAAPGLSPFERRVDGAGPWSTSEPQLELNGAQVPGASPQPGAAVYGDDAEVVGADDVHFLLPLFVEVINFAATLCSSGHRNVAVQVATKLTSQPSLLGFFIPHTAQRLQELFTAVESGVLQRQFFSAFQERRSQRMLRLRRGEFMRNGEAAAASRAAALFEETEDGEEDDKALQVVIDQKIASILASTTVVFRFFTAALSPRLFLTRPAPPPLLPQSGRNHISLSRILNWSYAILATHTRAGFGVGEVEAVLNGFQLLSLKACVLDGLAGSFETSAAEATKILGVFIELLLPILVEDLAYLKSLASDDSAVYGSSAPIGVFAAGSPNRRPASAVAPAPTAHRGPWTSAVPDAGPFGSAGKSRSGATDCGTAEAAPSQLIRRWSSELLGRLGTAVVTYFTSIVFRRGYRQRYGTASAADPQFSTNELLVAHEPSAATSATHNVRATSLEPGSPSTPVAAPGPSRTAGGASPDPGAGSLPTSLLLPLARFVVGHILPLLYTPFSSSGSAGATAGSGAPEPLPQLPSGCHWKLAVVTLKFLRCILRGPLPLLRIQEVDRVSRESFATPGEAGVEDGAEATAWLMRCFLALDSVVLDTVMQLTRVAWQQLLSPWDPAESSAGLAQVQTVEAGLDIMVTLFQRDAIFLCWWETLRRAAVTAGKNGAAAEWEFVSGLVPIHSSFLRDGVPASALPAVCQNATELSGHPDSNTTETFPRALFFFELISSEHYRDLRKRGVYLLHQLNQRDPRSVAALLSESPYHLGALQTALASMLRDIELEEFEQWEYLDYLGLLSNSDFPIPDLPETLLSPCFVEEDVDECADGISMEARLRDSLSIWSFPHGLELSRFYDEVAETDLPALLHQSVLSTSADHDTAPPGHRGAWDPHAQVHAATGSRVHRQAFKSMASWGVVSTANGRAMSSLITSKYTGLPVHRKLERRILVAEEAAVIASDSASWNAALHVLDDVPEQFRAWVAAALPHLTPEVTPPLFYLIPDVAARMVLNSSGQQLAGAALFEEAAAALRGDGGSSSLNLPGRPGDDPADLSAAGVGDTKPASARRPAPLITQIASAGPSGSTSRGLCLQFLLQGIKQALSGSSPASKDDSYTVPTVLQLLGFVRVSEPALTRDRASSVQYYYSTALPLPFVTSPFLAAPEKTSPASDDAEESQINLWLHSSMILLDSLALVLEDADLWINELPGSPLHESASLLAPSALAAALGHDRLAVQDALTDPHSYTDAAYRVYHEARTTLICLEILTLLLTNVRTTDAMLYLLFVRLPHRHAILSQLLTARWDSFPAILASSKKLICGSWVQLIMYEAYLCSSYMSQKSGFSDQPSWLVTAGYPPNVLKARLDALQNQCRQVSDGVWALLQSPLGSGTAAELSAVGLSCPQGTPTLLSCLLTHLAAAERLAVPQDPHLWGPDRSALFSECTTPLGLMLRCESWSPYATGSFRQRVCELVTPLLHPHQVLIRWRAGRLNGPQFAADDAVNPEVTEPVSNIMDFNHRSLAVFAAQRLAGRLAELFAASLELITVELRGAMALYCDDDRAYSSLSSATMQETLSGCILRCLDALNAHCLSSQRSRYCLVSVTGSLVSALVALVEPHRPRNGSAWASATAFGPKRSADSRSLSSPLDDEVPLNRAFLKSLIQKMLQLCVDAHDSTTPRRNKLQRERRPSWEAQLETPRGVSAAPAAAAPGLALGADEKRLDGSLADADPRPRGVDRTLRLRLYVAISQVLKLAKIYTPGVDTQLLASVVEGNSALIESLLNQLLADLLRPALPSSCFRIPYLSRHAFPALTTRYVDAQDPDSAVQLFPGLNLSPVLACVPLLKTLIDFDACQTLREALAPLRLTSADTSRQQYPHPSLVGHTFTPDSWWTPTSSMMQAIQSWVGAVFRDIEAAAKPAAKLHRAGGAAADTASGNALLGGFSYGTDRGRGTAAPSSGGNQQSTAQCMTPSFVSVAQLAFSLLRALVDQPALCEVLLASAIPVHSAMYMITTASVQRAPPAALCRTVLLTAPFLPRLNVPLTLEDFGFPVGAVPRSGTALHDPLYAMLDTSEDNLAAADATRVVCKPVSPAVSLLPVYFATLYKILSKLSYLEINLTVLAAEDPASREAPRTVQRASLYLFKWWLGRDRQFSFCFRCFQLAAEQLRRIQCTDTPVTSTASDTKPPRVGLERPSDASCRSPLRGDDVYGLLADDEAVGGSPSCAQEHLPLADVDILEIFGKRFSTLSHIIVLTSRIWLQLLTLVLKHMRVDDARYAAAPDAQAPGSHSTEALTALIPFDDILLTLQFQSRMTSSAVLITQLSAYKGIVDAHDGQTSSPFRSEAFRALLPTFSFHPAHLDIMLPHITSRRQFLINAMQSIRCEFGIAKNLLTQGKEQLGVGEGQQIREQLKRSILERTQSLAMISNAAVLGFLTVVPLERGGSGQLVRDIESFLYIPRWTQSCKRTTTSGGRYVLSSGAGTETRHQPTTHAAASATFYLRVLGYSTSLMIAGLQMLLGLEGVHLNLSSLVEHAAETSTPLPPHQFQPGYRPSPPPTDNKYIGSASTALLAELQPHSALLRHTLSAVHPTLGSPTQLRALRLCGRSAATVMGMSDIPGFASGAARFASQAETQPESLPLHLFHASAKIVCVEVFTLQTLLVAVTA